MPVYKFMSVQEMLNVAIKCTTTAITYRHFYLKQQVQCRVDVLKTDNAHFFILVFEYSLTYSTFLNMMCPLFEPIPILSTSTLELSLSNNIPHILIPRSSFSFMQRQEHSCRIPWLLKKSEIICTGCYSNNAFSIWII